MNPFKNTKTLPAQKQKIGTSTGYMPQQPQQAPKSPKIRKPNIKMPSATEVLKNGRLGDPQNFNS